MHLGCGNPGRIRCQWAHSSRFSERECPCLKNLEQSLSLNLEQAIESETNVLDDTNTILLQVYIAR